MKVLPHSHHGCKAATAQTPDSLNAEFVVGCSFTFFDVQLTRDLVKNLDGALNVAGCTRANGNWKLPFGLQTECLVERCKVIRTAQRNVQVFGDVFEDVLWQIVELILDIEQNLND